MNGDSGMFGWRGREAKAMVNDVKRNQIAVEWVLGILQSKCSQTSNRFSTKR